MHRANLTAQQNASHKIECFFVYYDTDINRLGKSYGSVTIAAAIINSFLAVFAVFGNAVVLTAFWRVPSLRKLSSALLCTLSSADFTVGLVVQPSFSVYKYAEVKSLPKTYCVTGLITETLGPYLAGVSGLTMTAMAIERFLYMRRRSSVLTMKRAVAIIFVIFMVPLPIVVFRFWFSGTKEYFLSVVVIYGIVGAICFVMIPYSYCRIFFIIRHHQAGIQANSNNSVDVLKYRKSVITLLWIVALFLITYLPYSVCIVWIGLGSHWRSGFARGCLNVTAMIVFANSMLNPLVYCLRIQEIRTFVKNALTVNFCTNRIEVLHQDFVDSELKWAAKAVRCRVSRALYAVETLPRLIFQCIKKIYL